MALSIGFELVQEQQLKLVMTPELQQAIHLLQLSAVELSQYIQEQLLTNPVLDHKEPERWTSFVDRSTEKAKWEPSDRTEPTLEEYLLEQLLDFSLSELEREICQALIYSLDDRGYLDCDIGWICKRFQTTASVVENCLRVIQSLEPFGVGARNLSECLEIQLRQRKDLHPLAIRIAKHHLNDVAEGRLKKIAHFLGVSVEEVQSAVNQIKTCNPKPGSSFAKERPQYIYPDLIIEECDGEFQISLNDQILPRLTIQDQYRHLLQDVSQYGEEYLSYIKKQIQSAIWLIKGLEQRKWTLYRVAEAIVSLQRDFFEKGKEYLRPLTLKQVAEIVGLHESTVSRATQNKYVQTPHGLFPFRFFFPAGVGGEVTVASVKLRIKQLIEQEDRYHPLSDQRLAELLGKEGIRISRRTVAKYREEMGIFSSARRKWVR